MKNFFQTLSRLRGCMPQSVFIFLASEMNLNLFSLTKTMLKIQDSIKSSEYK